MREEKVFYLPSELCLGVAAAAVSVAVDAVAASAAVATVFLSSSE